jgi:hypothetical protein
MVLGPILTVPPMTVSPFRMVPGGCGCRRLRGPGGRCRRCPCPESGPEQFPAPIAAGRWRRNRRSPGRCPRWGRSGPGAAGHGTVPGRTPNTLPSARRLVRKSAAPSSRGAQAAAVVWRTRRSPRLGQIPSAQPGRPLVIQKDRTGKHGHRAAQAGEKGGKTPVGVHRAGSDKLRPGGEAGLRRGAVIVVADHQKALRAGALQSRREPPGRRVEQDILQHEGGQIALPGQNYNRPQRVHKTDLPSHTGIRILYRIHYNKWPKALHRKLQKFFRKNGQKDRALDKRRGQFHKCRGDQAAAAALRRRRRRR